MRPGALLSALILLAVALALSSCGGVVNNPSPSITSLSPPTKNAGDPGFTLTVNGSGFAPQSTIVWNGAGRATIFLSDGQVTTQIQPSDIAFPGTLTVQVSTPSPGGGNSNILNFTINAVNNPVPNVSMLSPSGTLAGLSRLTIQVTGSNFVSQSIVTINNGNRQTSFFNSTTLQASLLSTDLTSACIPGPGSKAPCPQIGVINPAPGGGASNTVTLSISNPQPLLTTLSPTATPAGGTSAVALTINGSGFDMASVVHLGSIVFDGMNMDPVTTFVNNTQLTVSVATANLAAAGTTPVTVVNPTPGGGTSNSLGFSVTPTSSGGGLPELVDIANDGTQANNGIGDPTISGPVMDKSGEFIAFASVSSNLVPNDTNGVSDIFFRDTCLGGASGCTPQTSVVSVSSTGTVPNGASSEPSMDSAAQFVAFTSMATNLVSTGTFTGNQQVYLRGACHNTSGVCTAATTLISVATDGTSPANSDAFQPAISPDGRFVAFASAASNLVTGVTPMGFTQIYLYDTCHGASSSCKPSTILVSSPDGTTAATTPANSASSQPAVGNGGQFISFTSTATNLVTTPNTNGVDKQVFVRKTCLGTASGCTPLTALISIATDGKAGNALSERPAIDSNGQFVAFASLATNLVTTPNTNGVDKQVFVRNTCAGVSTGCMPSTTLISIAKDGTAGNALNERPAMDSTGQFVGFASQANNLVTASTNGFEQVFVRNTCTGASGTCTASTALVSVSAPSGTPPAPVVGNANSVSPALSGNGHFVSFISLATNLVATDTNNANDVFLATSTF